MYACYTCVVVVTEIRYHLDREADPTDRSAVEQVVDHVNDEVKKLEALSLEIMEKAGPGDARLISIQVLPILII